MSDIHALPLVGHDLPRVLDSELRGFVYCRPDGHGHLEWYWHIREGRKRPVGFTHHGPYASAREAGTEAAEWIEFR